LAAEGGEIPPMHKTKQADSWIRAKAMHFMRGRAADTSFVGGKSAKPAGAAPSIGRRLCHLLSLGFAGFIGGRALLFGAFTPFGPAYFLTVLHDFPAGALAAGAGVLLGAAVAGGWLQALEALLIMLLLTWLLPLLRLNDRKQSWEAALCLLGVAAAVRLVTARIFEPTVYRYTLVLADSFLAALAIPLFGQAISFLREAIYPGQPDRSGPIWAVAAASVLVLGLASLPAGAVSPLRIGVNLTVMAAAYLGGGAAGAGAGVAGGVLLDLARGLIPANIGLYAFCGFLSGCFRRLGRIGIGLGYVAAFLLCTVYLENMDSSRVLTETLLAGTVLLFIPERCFGQVRRLFPGAFTAATAGRKRQELLQETVSTKLRELGHVFHELSGAFSQVSGTASPPGQDWTEMMDAVTNRVCKTCGVSKTCWERDFYNSYQMVMGLIKTAEEHGCIPEDRMGEDAGRRCIRLPEMVGAINHLAELYRLDGYWRRKIGETREVVSGQLAGIAQIIKALAAEVKMDFNFQTDAEASVRSELDRLGTGFRDAEIVSLEKENTEIILTRAACQGSEVCRTVIAPALSRLLGQNLTVQKINCTRNIWHTDCRFRLCTDQIFRVEVGVCRTGKDGGSISGDSYSVRRFQDGKLFLMLSDGMGSGDRAAMESNATIALLEQLLSAGFERDLAVRTVNSILVLRSPEEIFATVDIAVIDQRQGTAEFVKIGAAASYLKCGDSVNVIEASSLPIGILQDIDVSTIRCDLTAGDVIVLATDGVTDAGNSQSGSGDWLAAFLRETDVDNPQILAEAILLQAKNIGQGKLADDMAVIVGRITDKQ